MSLPGRRCEPIPCTGESYANVCCQCPLHGGARRPRHPRLHSADPRTWGGSTGRCNWGRINRVATRWLPLARPQHPWPIERFDRRTRCRSLAALAGIWGAPSFHRHRAVPTATRETTDLAHQRMTNAAWSADTCRGRLPRRMHGASFFGRGQGSVGEPKMISVTRQGATRRRIFVAPPQRTSATGR